MAPWLNHRPLVISFLKAGSLTMTRIFGSDEKGQFFGMSILTMWFILNAWNTIPCRKMQWKVQNCSPSSLLMSLFAHRRSRKDPLVVFFLHSLFCFVLLFFLFSYMNLTSFWLNSDLLLFNILWRSAATHSYIILGVGMSFMPALFSLCTIMFAQQD